MSRPPGRKDFYGHCCSLFIVTNKYPCNLWVQIIKRLQQGSIMLVMFECVLCLSLQLLLLSLQSKSLDDRGLKVWGKKEFEKLEKK